MKQERNSNQTNIFRETTASKLQRKHAEQFNFCQYEVLCSATKTEIHRGVFHGILQNFRTATFYNNLGTASQKNRELEKDAQ